MCYTYDSVGKVLSRTVKNLCDDSIIATELFTYDAAGNVTDAPDLCFEYDTNNRLTKFCNNTVSYDPDGNMLSNGSLYCTYDSANRLVSVGGQNYTYNAEDIRIRNLCINEDTTYTYDTNAKLSRLLCKTTNGVTTKYVYGRGLIGEEINGTFKTYHFDCRGSTIAITDASGNITDTFAYDTYGKLISRTGTSKVIFGYNGRDGVITDDNGLIYMRARYYSPEMKRFINADIVAGEISNAVTLNRFAYANGNPVSFVDPFGLSAERGTFSKALENENTGSGFSSFIDFICDTIGVTSSFGNEVVTSQYDILNFIDVENGMGYSKNFDSGKPINIVLPNITNPELGFDINIEGFGFGGAINSEDLSFGAHFNNHSIDVGLDEKNNAYFKFTHTKDDGFIFTKYTVNNQDFWDNYGEDWAKAITAAAGIILVVAVIAIGATAVLAA